MNDSIESSNPSITETKEFPYFGKMRKDTTDWEWEHFVPWMWDFFPMVAGSIRSI